MILNIVIYIVKLNNIILILIYFFAPIIFHLQRACATVKVPIHGSIKRRAYAQKTITSTIAQDSELRPLHNARQQAIGIGNKNYSPIKTWNSKYSPIGAENRYYFCSYCLLPSIVQGPLDSSFLRRITNM